MKIKLDIEFDIGDLTPDDLMRYGAEHFSTYMHFLMGAAMKFKDEMHLGGFVYDFEVPGFAFENQHLDCGCMFPCVVLGKRAEYVDGEQGALVAGVELHDTDCEHEIAWRVCDVLAEANVDEVKVTSKTLVEVPRPMLCGLCNMIHAAKTKCLVNIEDVWSTEGE